MNCEKTVLFYFTAFTKTVKNRGQEYLLELIDTAGQVCSWTLANFSILASSMWNKYTAVQFLFTNLYIYTYNTFCHGYQKFLIDMLHRAVHWSLEVEWTWWTEIAWWMIPQFPVKFCPLCVKWVSNVGQMNNFLLEEFDLLCRHSMFLLMPNAIISCLSFSIPKIDHQII